uniref:ATP synthase complex subunit 8 n=1 Tax=Deronectes parvicollis TaxID=1309448 RepID=A0A894JNI6_9DYTI|nr:ATP synthase F0 subunit 8 [Deronectes parvicollis]
MPQMAPMNWLFLYMFFFVILIMFNFMTYYMFLLKNNNLSLNKINKKNYSWKW